MPNIFNADNGVVSGSAGIKLSSDTSGVLNIQTNGTTAISISASQVVSFPATSGFSFAGQVTFAAGTAAAPSISVTGDTNTGIYFPAADTIAFTEGGVESARFNASGQLDLVNNPILTGGTANGVTYLNGSKVLTSGSSLTYNGTTLNATGLPAAYFTIGVGAPQFAFGYAADNAVYHRMRSNGGANDGVTIELKNDTASINLVNTPYIGFNTNGSERLRIDASGNLGLGVTPSAWNSGYRALQIGNQVALWGATSNNIALSLGRNVFFDGSFKYIATDEATLYQQSASGAHEWYTAASGTAGNAITFTQAMTLTAGGILLVGTVNPPTASGAKIAVADSIDTSIQITKNGVVATRLKAVNTALAFGVDLADGDTERARITSGGDFLLNTTTKGYGLFSSSRFTLGNGGAGDGFCVGGLNENLSAYTVQGNNNTGTRYAMYIANGSSTPVGTISFTSAATAYNTSSDRRLKDNIALADDAGAIIDAIEVVKHDWKVGGHTRYGMIAQDLYMVAPEAVTIGDSEDVETLKNPWGVDYSKLVPMLVKEIQSLRARVAQLEAK